MTSNIEIKVQQAYAKLNTRAKANTDSRTYNFELWFYNVCLSGLNISEWIGLFVNYNWQFVSCFISLFKMKIIYGFQKLKSVYVRISWYLNFLRHKFETPM
jgi:hypothetical protein